MGMRVEDSGEFLYGGLVTGMRKLDESRMAKGQLTDKDVLKKYETWAFLVPGAGSTLMSAFGWGGRRIEPWAEHVSHGFIYGFPQFIVDVVESMRTGGSSSSAAKKAAVKEAQRILQAQKQLGAGNLSRSYQEEFSVINAW